MSLEVDIDHRREHFRLQAAFVSRPGLTALFGRSGSGKTTLVDIVSGLIRPQRGRVVVDGHVLVDTERGIFVPKHRRRIGYVFQEGRLFPHLSVRQNLLFGRWFTPANGAGAKDGAGGDLDTVVELLGIGRLLERKPDSLSGGEKQRVAIGRALLAHPRLLLMDEPLSSLDDARRAEILPYIERLRDEAGVPIVYVSHSVAEVARLATTVVVLSEGHVAAAGPVLDILGRLDVFPLAEAGEGGGVLDTHIARHDDVYHLTVLASQAGELQVPRLAAAVGTPVRAHIRARDVMLSLQPPEGISALNVLAGRIVEIGTSGTNNAVADIRLDCNGATLIARLTAKSVERLRLAPGRPVYAVIKSVSFASPT
jgi:molybdate transport system ATP-binding protein